MEIRPKCVFRLVVHYLFMLASAASPVAPLTSTHYTVLCAELVTETSPTSNHTPNWRDLFNTLWHYIETTLNAHSGQLYQRQERAFVAVWQAATPTEAAERAVRAALALRQAATAATLMTDSPEAAPIYIHLGLHSGINLNPQTQEELLATALQLQKAARPNVILISHETYRHVRGIFDIQSSPIPPGLSLPAVYYVTQAKPRAFRRYLQTWHDLEIRTIGREAEVQRLQDHMQLVLEAHQPQAVTIVGAVGLGKSRLVYELDNWLDLLPEKIWIFRGRAGEEAQHTPYALLRDLFAFRFEILETDAPAVARAKFQRGCLAFLGNTTEALVRSHFLGQLVGLDFSDSPHLRGILDEPKYIRDLAVHYFAQLLITATRQYPVVMVLDDLQWADDGSLGVLLEVLQICRNVPLFLVMLARPELYERYPQWGEHLEAHTRLNLPPLSELECGDLLAELLQKLPEIPADLHTKVAQYAQGTPLYVTELVHWWVEEAVLHIQNPFWRLDETRLATLPLPTTLTELLETRFQRLPTLEKQVLQLGAVIGRVFWDETLNALLAGTGSKAELLWALNGLVQKGFIINRSFSAFPETRAYIFVSTLLRDVAYANVPTAQLPGYHQQVAEWLVAAAAQVAHPPAVLIAQHYGHTELHAATITWRKQVANQLRTAGAFNAACQIYQQALHLATAAQISLADQLELYASLADILQQQGHLTESVQAYTALKNLAEQLGNRPAQARAMLGLANAQNNQRAALELARQAEALARAAQAPEILAEAFSQQGWSLHALGELAEAIFACEKALELLPPTNPATRQPRARCYNLLGLIHQAQGEFELADYYREQALELHQEAGHTYKIALMLNNIAESARLRGNYKSATVRYQEPLRLAREIGHRALESMILSNLGGARLGQGNPNAAEGDLCQALLLVGNDTPYFLGETYNFLALTYLQQKRGPEAIDAALRAKELAQLQGDQTILAINWHVMGLLRAANLDLDAAGVPSATECFEAGAQLFAAMHDHPQRARLLADWAKYEFQQNRVSRAKTLQNEARLIFTRCEMRTDLEKLEAF